MQGATSHGRRRRLIIQFENDNSPGLLYGQKV
jgi:hypothetical protein